MSGGGQVRVRRATAVLLGLLLALCGAAQARAAAPSLSPTAAQPAQLTQTAHAAQTARTAHAIQKAHAAQESAYSPRTAYDAAAPADESGSSRCHKSKGDDGALPAVPSTTQQKTQTLALPVCLTPESHAAIGTAHARPPVRGPAPAPPPTPIELSVLRV
ncbi:hypothetical protein [Streptomyces axinellae]